MGHCCSTRSKQLHPVTFDRKELAVLEEVFNNECDKFPEYRFTVYA
jgi:hypothetical protein